MERATWEKILRYYYSIKSLYIDCEETDPEMKTNLQPLNEFRAALDHVMRIIAIENTDEFKEFDADKEAERLLSHLKRAFYDVCDMLSINYRNKIVDYLDKYNSDIIGNAIPDYYPVIRPRIEELTSQISILRTEKGFSKVEAEDRMEQYLTIISELREFYKKIRTASVSLEELAKKEQKVKKQRILTQYIIPIGGVVVGAIVAIIGWVV